MKTLGIIGEYNPLHQGHKYLIENAMRLTGSDVCVSIMSGNFTQRGTPAVHDKWERAKVAVNNGINLVVELPTVYACNSAEYFAKGAVEILEGIGAVDYIAFGSENGDINQLINTKNFLSENSTVINKRIMELNRQGISYPRARQIAVEEIDPTLDDSVIKEPNNILALEYLKQIRTMKAVTIKRSGQGYHQSATSIREAMLHEDPKRFEMIDKTFFDLVAAKILQTKASDLEKIFSAGEGLGNKLKNEIRYVSSIEELIDKVKSKAYTHTRISRFLTQVLLDIDKDIVENASCYIRVLALDNVGANFIKRVKKTECASLPIITNINKELNNFPNISNTIEKDILASDIYNLICKNDLYDYSDYTKRPYVKL